MKRKAIDDEKFSITAEKIMNKLLTYSIPKVENDMEYVDVRFFPSEASDLIWQLLIQNDRKIEKKDYYSILMENREKLRSESK